MQDIYSIYCSPIENVNGVNAFIVNLLRRSKTRIHSMDRLAVQMPGHIVLRNIGFKEDDIGAVNNYIDEHLESIVGMALDATENYEAAL